MDSLGTFAAALDLEVWRPSQFHQEVRPLPSPLAPQAFHQASLQGIPLAFHQASLRGIPLAFHHRESLVLLQASPQGILPGNLRGNLQGIHQMLSLRPLDAASPQLPVSLAPKLLYYK